MFYCSTGCTCTCFYYLHTCSFEGHMHSGLGLLCWCLWVTKWGEIYKTGIHWTAREQKESFYHLKYMYKEINLNVQSAYFFFSRRNVEKQNLMVYLYNAKMPFRFAWNWFSGSREEYKKYEKLKTWTTTMPIEDSG